MAQRIIWGAGREDAFKDYLDREMQQALAARSAVERTWIRWLEQYRAPANRPLKSFPFEGAANFELPLTAIDVDQLYAKFFQTIHAPTNTWTLEPLNPGWEDAAKPLQDFLEWLDGAMLHMEQVNKRALLELVKLGTAIYKTGWLFERRTIKTYDDQGKTLRVERTISKPTVDHVRLADFLIPPYAYEIDPDLQGGAPWIAERFRRGIDALESIADSSEPYLPNYGLLAIQKLRQQMENRETDYDAAIQGMDYNKVGMAGQTLPFDTSTSTVPEPGKSSTFFVDNEVEWWQIHARFATQKAGGSQDDIVVEYHRPTRMMLRAIYQPYRHSKRPYDVARFFPGEGFYGIGVCEQKEMFQRSESDLFNTMHDNTLLSNAVGIAAKQGSNIGPGEPIYPGKIWITDGNPRDELMAFNLSQPYQGLVQIQGMVNELGKLRTGIGDLQSGNINALPSRTPATSVQAMLEEGARRPDLTLTNIRDCLSGVGLKTLQNVQQYLQQPGLGAGGEIYMDIMVKVLGPEAAAPALQALALSQDSIELGLGVMLTATSATANKELAKQNLMALVQLQTQIGPPILQALTQAMQAQGTPVGQAALDWAQGMVFLQKRVLEQSDIRNVHELVPTIPKDPGPPAGFPAPPPSPYGPAPAFPLLGGGGGPPQGPPGSSGMEALPSPAGAGGPGGI
jgi:hypothetical protein